MWSYGMNLLNYKSILYLFQKFYLLGPKIVYDIGKEKRI